MSMDEGQTARECTTSGSFKAQTSLWTRTHDIQFQLGAQSISLSSSQASVPSCPFPTTANATPPEELMERWGQWNARDRVIGLRRWILDLEWSLGALDGWMVHFIHEWPHIKCQGRTTIAEWLVINHSKASMGRMILGYLSQVMDGRLSGDLAECRDLALQTDQLDSVLYSAVIGLEVSFHSPPSLMPKDPKKPDVQSTFYDHNNRPFVARQITTTASNVAGSSSSFLSTLVSGTSPPISLTSNDGLVYPMPMDVDDSNTVDNEVPPLLPAGPALYTGLPGVKVIPLVRKRYKNSDIPLATWEEHRDEYLDELMGLDGRGRFQSNCAGCTKQRFPEYRCKDCTHGPLWCKDCLLKQHR
ncbi:hypothetical protein HWV62_21998 [Athelia sp. TMB]|nr:hypothetical protein HWV62_21998 [Athelia sp. TMB]